MSTQKKDFWELRYVHNEIAWDIGEVSTPIKVYINQLVNKKLKILIPGAGNSYEAEYLFNNGFESITILDWAGSALKNIKTRVPKFPSKNLLAVDFFKHFGSYDIIIEQTFFCAIDKNLRKNYVNKVHSLLEPKGKLIGLLFNVPLHIDHPPFGGNKEEYLDLFKEKFIIKTMENAYNSIKPRENNELFIILEKK